MILDSSTFFFLLVWRSWKFIFIRSCQKIAAAWNAECTHWGSRMDLQDREVLPVCSHWELGSILPQYHWSYLQVSHSVSMCWVNEYMIPILKRWKQSHSEGMLLAKDCQWQPGVKARPHVIFKTCSNHFKQEI